MTDDTLPEIVPDGTYSARCTGCGDTGPVRLNGSPVILHEPDCPHAEDGE